MVRLWFALVLAMGWVFAQGSAPDWGGLFDPLFVAAVWTALSSRLTIPVTEKLREWLGSRGIQTSLLNGAVNAVVVGVGIWLGGGYQYGLNGLAFSVAASLVGWAVDSGLVNYQKRVGKGL